MATAPSPNDLTRQQLDELDALLQRMLAIPLNQPEPSAPPTMPFPPLPETVAAPPRTSPSPNWRVDSPPPATAPAPHVIPMPVAMPPAVEPPAPKPMPAPERFVPPEPVARMPAPQPTLPETPPAKDDRPETLPFEPPASRMDSKATAEAPAPFAFPYQAPAESPAEPEALAFEATTVPPPFSATSPRRTRRVPVLFWPFVAINFVIDGTLRLTGFPGRVVTSGFIKTLFGLSGLGLMAYTGAYIAQQKGWITLSTPLPWPR